MNSRIRIALCVAVCLASALVVPAQVTEPFSNIPPEQRESLSKRIGAYVEENKTRKWGNLFALVSDTGRGGANRHSFVAAMKSSHGSDFAQDPDLMEFKSDRTEKNDDGYDIYGCGKARREGMMFNGVAVLHAVFERNDWFFTGWSFTGFPNEPCASLSNPKWQPFTRLKWNGPMEEIANFKSQGMPFHVDGPR
jgi:hypothetical protein